MKAEELMIGDWVQGFVPDSNSTIYGIFNEQRIAIIAEPIKAYIELSIDEIRPIPLTPEILEKNGFGEQIFERMSVWSILGFSIELDFSTWKYYWANGDVEISSVHELQHALKLCGIEKEVVL